jgi:hypothetical protein
VLEPLLQLPYAEEVEWEGVENDFARNLGRVVFDNECSYPDNVVDKVSRKEKVRRKLPEYDWNVPRLNQNVFMKMTKAKYHWHCKECFSVFQLECEALGYQGFKN